jgi:uncharacterized iron-regulated membrane protein
VAALYLSVMGVTGSLLVFRGEIQNTTNRRALPISPSGAPLPLDHLARMVVGEHEKLTFVRLPKGLRDAIEIFLRDTKDSKDRNGEWWLVNPYTGERVNERDLPRLSWLDWLASLHHNLLSGRNGRLANGVGASLFLALCVTGPFIWWSGLKTWTRGLKVDFAARGRRLAIELHKAVGFWALLLLTILAVTGISFTWGKQVQSVVYALAGGPSRNKAPKIDRHPEPDLSIERILERAQQALPTGTASSIVLPERDKDPAPVWFHLSGDLSESGNIVYLHPQSGEILGIDLLRQRPFGERIVSSFSPLHFGRFGGVAVKIVWVLLGLTPGTLAVTGFLIWWKRAAGRWFQQA